MTIRLRELPGITWPLDSREIARRTDALARSCSSVVSLSQRSARRLTLFRVKR